MRTKQKKQNPVSRIASMGLALKSVMPPINHLDIVTYHMAYYNNTIQKKDIHTSQLGKIEYIIQISDNNKNKKKQQNIHHYNEEIKAIVFPFYIRRK